MPIFRRWRRRPRSRRLQPRRVDALHDWAGRAGGALGAGAPCGRVGGGVSARPRPVCGGRREGECVAHPAMLAHAARRSFWAEIGDARLFSSSDQLVRFAGTDVTVYSSDAKRSLGHCPGRAPPSCGGPHSRRPNAQLGAVPRITATTTAGGQARRPQWQKPDPGSRAQNLASLLSHAA